MNLQGGFFSHTLAHATFMGMAETAKCLSFMGPAGVIQNG